jgi:glycosyltransferase
MKISIITATYNSAAHIAGCLASVNNQSYQNIEHIIIDGASTDSTLEIIKATSPKNLNGLKTKIISEPDTGIYDALNKGIQHATGDIIGFLHADDTFANPHTLQNIVDSFSPPGGDKEGAPDGIYGHLVFVNNENKVLRTWHSKPFNRANVHYGWAPPHPTLFLKKEVYQKHGPFDTTFRIAGDYDFMLRIMLDEELNFQLLPVVITRMQLGGASTGNLKSQIKKTREDMKALRNNGFKMPLFTLGAKKIRKIPQWLKR